MKDKDYYDSIECESCHSVYTTKDAPESCKNCGSKLPVSVEQGDLKLLGYERFQNLVESLDESAMFRDTGNESLAQRIVGPVTCCWCGEYYSERGNRVNCDSCGGNLPMPACNDPGPKPERSPRQLPSGYWMRLFILNNVGMRVTLFITIVGSIVFGFFIPFLFYLISVLGILLIALNHMELARRYIALKKGTPILGKVQKVRITGRANNPKNTEKGKADMGLMFRMHFTFEFEGEKVKGIKDTHDPAAKKYFPGQPVWIVYVPKKKYYSLWPPIA